MNINSRGQHLTSPGSPPNTEPEFLVKDTANAGLCNLIIGKFLSDCGSQKSNQKSTYQKALELEDPSAIGVTSLFSQESTNAASTGSFPSSMARIERPL